MTKTKRKVYRSGLFYKKCTRCGDPCLEMTVEQALKYSEFVLFGGSPVYCELCKGKA